MLIDGTRTQQAQPRTTGVKDDPDLGDLSRVAPPDADLDELSLVSPLRTRWRTLRMAKSKTPMIVEKHSTNFGSPCRHANLRGETMRGEP